MSFNVDGVHYDHRNRMIGAKDWISGPYPEDDGEGVFWGWGPSSLTDHWTVGPTIGQGTGWGWGSSTGSGTGSTSGVTIFGEVTAAIGCETGISPKR